MYIIRKINQGVRTIQGKDRTFRNVQGETERLFSGYKTVNNLLENMAVGNKKLIHKNNLISSLNMISLVWPSQFFVMTNFSKAELTRRRKYSIFRYVRQRNKGQMRMNQRQRYRDIDLTDRIIAKIEMNCQCQGSLRFWLEDCN